jgi:hypothetical protein
VSRDDFPSWIRDRHVRLLWARWRRNWYDITPMAFAAFAFISMEEKP